jgi:hypothetical protein
VTQKDTETMQIFHELIGKGQGLLIDLTAEMRINGPFDTRVSKYGRNTNDEKIHWTLAWQDVFCLMAQVIQSGGNQ